MILDTNILIILAIDEIIGVRTKLDRTEHVGILIKKNKN